MSKMFLNRDFAYAREIIQKSLTLDSGKFVMFIQAFGPLVSFSYNLVLFKKKKKKKRKKNKVRQRCCFYDFLINFFGPLIFFPGK